MDDNYKIPQPEGASELREPAVAYCPGVRAAVEPWAVNVTDGEPDGDSDFWDELDKLCGVPPTAPDGKDWVDNDPEFRAAVLRRADEVMARVAAGEKGYTTEELFDELEWRIKNDKWDDIIDIEAMNQYGKI
jgi:hypothetical protein